MKKINYIILLTITCISLTACGERSTPAENGDSTPQVDTNQIDLNDVDYPNIEDAVPFCTVDLSTTDYDTELAITIVAPVSHITTIIMDEKTLAFEADDPRHVEISYSLSNSDYDHKLVVKASGTDNVACSSAITIKKPEPKKNYVTQANEAFRATQSTGSFLATQPNQGVSALNPQAAVITHELDNFSCADTLGAIMDDDGMCVCDTANGFERNATTGDCECRSDDNFVLDDNTCSCIDGYFEYSFLDTKMCEPITNINCGKGHFDPTITDGNKCVCDTGARALWDSYQETHPDIPFVACTLCDSEKGFISGDDNSCICDNERNLVLDEETQSCGCADGYEMVGDTCKAIFVAINITIDTSIKSYINTLGKDNYHFSSYRKGDLSVCIGSTNTCDNSYSFINGLPIEQQESIDDKFVEDKSWNFYFWDRDPLTSHIPLITSTADKEKLFPLNIMVPANDNPTDALTVKGVKVEGIHLDGTTKTLYFHPCVNRSIEDGHPLTLQLDDLGICYRTSSADPTNSNAYIPTIEFLVEMTGTPSEKTLAYEETYTDTWGEDGLLIKHRAKTPWARWIPDNYRQYDELENLSNTDNKWVSLGGPSMALHAWKTEYDKNLKDVWSPDCDSCASKFWNKRFHWLSDSTYVFGTHISGGANLISDWNDPKGPAFQIRVDDSEGWMPDHIFGKIFKPGAPKPASFEDTGYMIRIATPVSRDMNRLKFYIPYEEHAKNGSLFLENDGVTSTWPEIPGYITFKKPSNEKVFTQENFDTMTSFFGDAIWE